MDFTKQFQSQLFSEQGFQSKNIFSLLGVSYYLTKDELASLLNHLFALVPSGSSIVWIMVMKHSSRKKDSPIE